MMESRISFTTSLQEQKHGQSDEWRIVYKGGLPYECLHRMGYRGLRLSNLPEIGVLEDSRRSIRLVNAAAAWSILEKSSEVRKGA